MSLHDWRRVPDNVFHAFHVWWLGEIGKELNRSVLPEEYIARPEESLGPFDSDVLTLETRVATRSRGRRTLKPGRAREPVPTIDPPRLRSRRQRRIAIFSAREERRVAVLEVVLPGNKDSDRRARAFEEKILACIESGLHVLVVDPLPATEAAPGLAAAVARALGSGKVPLGGRCAASFEWQPEPPVVRVYNESLRVGRAIPDASLFLEPGLSVDVPLERTYREAVAAMPAVDRDRLVG